MQSTRYKLADGSEITISHGNSKIGVCTNWNLPPILSCVQGIPCARDCYAVKLFKLYPNCRKAYLKNLYAVQSALDETMTLIRYHLSVHPTDYVRIHVSGDFISQAYLDRWIDIATDFPEMQFLAFTKRYTFDYNAAPNNLKIVFSAWPGLQLPEVIPSAIAGVAYMMDKDNPDNRIPEGALQCAGNCTDCRVCWQLDKIASKSVYFHKH